MFFKSYHYIVSIKFNIIDMRLIFTLITSLCVFSSFAVNLRMSEEGSLHFKKYAGKFSNLSAVQKQTNSERGIKVANADMSAKNVSTYSVSSTYQAGLPSKITIYLIKRALKNNPYSVGSTYMWKNIFESTVNDTLLSQLSNYGIDTLLLSPGTNGIKITDFLTKAQNQSIHVSRLLSENSYAKDSDGVQKLIAKMQTLQYDFPGLHLNIEPHTFADYKTNIPFYTARMDSIYDVAKQWCDPRNMKLTVSIPMHLPLQNATFLANNDITAYIMAYENTDQQKLLTRTLALRTALQNKYVWVLRVSDFATQQDLLDAIAYLNANGVSRVALYDFSTVTTMF